MSQELFFCSLLSRKGIKGQALGRPMLRGTHCTGRQAALSEAPFADEMRRSFLAGPSEEASLQCLLPRTRLGDHQLYEERKVRESEERKLDRRGNKVCRRSSLWRIPHLLVSWENGLFLESWSPSGVSWDTSQCQWVDRAGNLKITGNKMLFKSPLPHGDG